MLRLYVLGLSLKIEILFRHLADLPADGERRSCAGRRRVKDMNGAPAVADDKVIDQRSVGGDRLGAHPGPARDQIALADFRQQFLQRANECRLAE